MLIIRLQCLRIVVLPVLVLVLRGHLVYRLHRDRRKSLTVVFYRHLSLQCFQRFRRGIFVPAVQRVFPRPPSPHPILPPLPPNPTHPPPFAPPDPLPLP